MKHQIQKCNLVVGFLDSNLSQTKSNGKGKIKYYGRRAIDALTNNPHGPLKPDS